MPTINFTVEGHNILVDNLTELAQESNNFDTCAFTFDSSWDGFTLYAVMYQDPKNVFKKRLDNENKCKIPAEKLKKSGWLYIGARGEKADQTVATTIMFKIRVRNGAVDGTETGQEVLNESQYEHLLGEINKLKGDLNELDDRVTYLEEHGTGGGEGGSTGGSGERVPTFLRGLKYYAIGDSIVEYQGTSENPITYTGSDLQGTQHTNEVVKGYIQEIESKYGMVCTNFGLGGHTLIQDYASLIAKDYSDVALVTISYGCNDARLGNPLGTVNSSDVTTYAGALNGLIKKIYTDNPECRIIVLSAIQRLRVSDFGIADANVNGNYLIDFVDMAKKVAERRSCYFIDMYRNSGINQTNLYYYTREGVHPLNTGYLRMSALVMDEMRKITSVVFNPFGVMTNTGATEPDAPDTGGGSDTPPQDEEKATEVEVSSLLTKDGYVYDGWPNDVMGRGEYKGIEVGQLIYLEPNKTYTLETYRSVDGTDSRIACVSNDASATKGGQYLHGAAADKKGWVTSEVASGVYKWTKIFSTADADLPKVSGITCRYLSFGCLNGWTDKAKLSYV